MRQAETVPSMENLNEQFLTDYFRNNADVVFHRFHVSSESDSLQLLLIYNDGLADIKQLNQFILPRLETMFTDKQFQSRESIEGGHALPLTIIGEDNLLNELTLKIFSGSLVIYAAGLQVFLSIDIANPPARTPEESATEAPIRGPRDGFTEELTVNTALIRKRLRSPSFCVEQFVIEGRGHTSIALFYVDDIINPAIVDEVRGILQSIDTDAVIGTAYIEDILKNNKYTVFPLADYTGRPDYVVNALLNGRFAVMFQGSPMALIAPVSILNLLISAEDANTPSHIVILERLLRFTGLFIALFFPGFYLALTCFNLEQVPLPLLATINNVRNGLPLSVTMETFMMLFLFEIFSEAGRRLPKAVGQTITVVGGLIIGDAAIRAGITSPTMIVMVAITIIATHSLVNQILSGTTAIIRIMILILSALFGMYGFLIAVIGLVLHLAGLENFGVPYLSSVSPFNKNDFVPAFFRKPARDMKKRPEYLQTQDDTRKENRS
ncbi:spore germination protein [Paenibacillus sp. J22TS3]|uniref:spore germination protein n=1 Tax=Paenibacillus sp. J22TS3 TaxID=2807192 RepID=UPI001B2193F9|nr:spore germination protein [Paenibacillus sp. J22TS3]GIP23932.1 spore germination protein [Paenibacillus sp. J22TS3]